MKIAFLNKYQKKVSRGAETFVYELSRRLSKGNDVTVIDEVSYFDLLRTKYDFVIPTNGRFQVVLVRIITWLKKEKMIVSGQSGIGWDEKINLLTFPDAFVALSDKAYSWAKKFNHRINVRKIPNGVDTERFKDTGSTYKSGLKRPLVLAVGAFTEQKQLKLAIDAVKLLKDVSLLVVGGGGELKEQLKGYGGKLLGKRFDLISVKYESMPDVYRSADVFTLPSRSSESFGNVILEAMSSGLPVVVSEDPIRKEIAGTAGIFVNPQDSAEYASAISSALSKKWGNIPRKQAEGYSWDIIALEYKKLLESLK